jgi:hypothetical protein
MEMCRDCHTVYCYNGCPFYEEETEIRSCDICGEAVDEEDVYYAAGEHCVCEKCAEGLSVDDLLELGGLCGIGDLLALFGYRRA